MTRHRHAELAGDRPDVTDRRARLDDQARDELVVSVLRRDDVAARAARG